MIKFDDLLKVKCVSNMINNKLDKIKQLEKDFDGLYSKRLTEKLQGGKTPRAYSEYRAEQIEKLKNEVLELMDYRQKVLDQINKLKNSSEIMFLNTEYILGIDSVEKLRKKKGEPFGYTKKEAKEILRSAETNFMILCMSESLQK